MKRLVLSIALLSSPLTAWADCASRHQQAMSCAEGMRWDAQANACVPVSTS
ncbi:hypothetical protein [Rubellimicrobium arenae]|uniref:hypothetical protein n=1 Tax=Rubellimicrobium arenae TaxID=2817372 RepID=UPI001B30AE28|nr:hypothetical protein [Rubellimicrobium arenae]